MAEIYPLGLNRIFYRVSPTSNPPEKITVDLIEDNPDAALIRLLLNNKELIEVGAIQGLYYFDADFPEAGTYIAVFYEWRGEDKIEKASKAFSTRKLPVRDVTVTGSRFLGENVIGG